MMITRRAMFGLAASVPLGAESLPNQSAGLALDRAFPDPRISYLVTECETGREICSRWARVLEPAPLGSLVKPFTALAFGESHDFQFPDFICLGEAAHCWLPQGHGRLGITAAIAHSCNAYLLELARDVSAESLARVTERFGIRAPGAADPGTLIGLGTGWQIKPLAMARAYSELVARTFDPGVAIILAGMALSGRSGTGRGVGGGAFVKTGTAPCSHESRGVGDGYTIALYPAPRPRYNLLVQVHGVPGARAAWVCGKMRRYV